VDERERDETGEPDSTLPDAPAAENPVVSRPRLRRLGIGAGRTLAAVLSAAVLGTMGYGWWAVGGVDEATVTTDVIDHEVTDQRVPLDGAVDMLLVGMDSRTDAYGNPLPRDVLNLLNAGRYEGERNTDTMILVHIPVDGTRAVAISFPRDAWVELAGGFGKHKLNSAFAYAWLDARGKLAKTIKDSKELDAQATVVGRKNLIATIELLIGKAVTIDRYAEVNLASFYEVTKAIGGVEVCLNDAVKDPKSGANFPAGRQIIEGAQALAFVRQRYGLPNGDLDRIVRQQVFLGALADKVLTADMLTSPAKVRELIGAVQRSVVLSNGWDLSTFAAQMQDLSSGNIDFYTIPTLGNAKIGGADVIKVDPQAVHQFVSGLTSDSTDVVGSPDVRPSGSPPTTTTTTPPTGTTRTSVADTRPPTVAPSGSITVDVRNASETRGLAGSVQQRLTQLGFLRGAVGDTPVQAVSVVRYASGEQLSAQLVASALGERLALEPDLTLAAGHVEVVLGTDYPTTQTQGFAGRFVAAPPTSGRPGSTTTTSTPATTQEPIVAGAHPCIN
jgi:LCP family protein required for cell wall assembly